MAQARKRSVQWSAQEQTRIALRKTTSSKKPSTLTNFQQQIETSPTDTDLSFHTPIPLSENRTDTIQAIQETLRDLHCQKEAIYIIIKVLEQRLLSLKKSSRK